jgi:hypothetical protein
MQRLMRAAAKLDEARREYAEAERALEREVGAFERRPPLRVLDGGRTSSVLRLTRRPRRGLSERYSVASQEHGLAPIGQ